MTSMALQRDALMPRSPDRRGSGFMLALVAHLLLVAALAFSVNWKASDPEGVEAELWAAVPQIAAPKATEPEPTPVKVEPKPEPKPVVKPEPKPEPKEETRPDAQIAIEKARKEDERKKKEEAEKLAQQQKLEKQKLDKEDKRKKELDDQRLAAEREKNLKRMMAAAGGGDATSTGRASQTAGPTANYLGRIKARIKPNVVFIDSVTGNPTVEVEITVAPDGKILSSRVTKPSGVKEWDEAVLRGIEKTAVLPRDTDGRVYSPMVIVYRPQDI
jgi:colicin import membrane protein